MLDGKPRESIPRLLVQFFDTLSEDIDVSISSPYKVEIKLQVRVVVNKSGSQYTVEILVDSSRAGPKSDIPLKLHWVCTLLLLSIV